MKYLFAASLCCFLLASHSALAAEPKRPPPAADPDPDDPIAKNNANRYKIPEDADSDALVEFCQNLQDYEPGDDAEAKMHEKRLPRVIKRACKRILELEKDKESDNARFARRMTLAMRLDTATEIDSPKADQLLEKVREFLASPNVIADDADVASALADFLGSHPCPKAVEWSQKIGTLLHKHAIPDVADAGQILLGTAKRLGLAGKPLQLKGTTIAGKAFDLTQLKGKVILVEFWATWCSHCLDEIPNMKKCYDGYHAKGFEIVAISADEERSELIDFLKDEQIPWINLYELGGKHPALDEFGINAFPSNILIGKDGKVAALDLRDAALSDELKKLMGAPDVTIEVPKTEPAPKGEPNKDAADENEDAADSVEKLKKKYTF